MYGMNGMMVGAPVMAGAGKVGMKNQLYPQCIPNVSGLCCLGLCCPCLAVKDNWTVLERFYDPRDRGEKRQADNVTIIFLLICCIGFAPCGLTWQRMKLAEEMQYTPPDIVLDLVCNCCCPCFTFEQDKDAIEDFRAVHSRVNITGMRNMLDSQMMGGMPMSQPPMMSQGPMMYGGGGMMHMSPRMQQSQGYGGGGPMYDPQTGIPMQQSYPVGGGSSRRPYSCSSPRGGGYNSPRGRY